MNYRCKLCGCDDVEVVYNPAKKSYTRPSQFRPTASDFGIFYRLGRCKGCKIISVLKDDEGAKRRLGYLESRDDLYLSQRIERTLTAQRAFDSIEGFLPKKARLLDIGCSYGFFLKVAQEQGVDVRGVELSKDACTYCNQSGLDVFCGDIKEAHFAQESFDAICALELIEHLKDPQSFIEEVRKLLKVGGMLYLVTPNIQSFSAKVLGWRWWSYRDMHLYYFSENTLCEFLKRNGFEPVKSIPYKKTLALDYMVAQLANTSSKAASGFFSSIEKILKAKKIMFTASFGDIGMVARKIS